MSSPLRRRAPKPDEAQAEVARIASVERKVVARLRDYLARGRLLASLPVPSLDAQWIAACLEVHGLEDDSRAEELRDLGTEFDLRGLEPPIRLVVPELARFRERFLKELRRRRPDPATVARARAELEAACDRLIAGQRASRP